MSVAYWQAVGSPQLAQSANMLKEFNPHAFQPHGVIQAFPIEFRGKTVSIIVEVIDKPLDYKLLLGRSWFCAMQAITSSVFHLVHFPHEGQIIMLDKLYFCTTSVHHGSIHTIPSIDNSHNSVESIGAGMFKYSSLLFSYHTTNWLHQFDSFRFSFI